MVICRSWIATTGFEIIQLFAKSFQSKWKAFHTLELYVWSRQKIDMRYGYSNTIFALWKRQIPCNFRLAPNPEWPDKFLNPLNYIRKECVFA